MAYHYLALPRVGRVLDFKVTEAFEGPPSQGLFVAAEVSLDAGTPHDFAATAVAIASVVPADTVAVTIERNDVPSSVGRWRRTLARAEYRQKEKPQWTVSTAKPLRSAKEIAASVEYSSRAGLALTSEGEPLTSEMDEALINSLAGKHGVSADRVKIFTSLHREKGDRTDWWTIAGPGSQHLKDLASCYAGKTRGTGEWKDCR
jgi:hypothetical protein